jgi:hypothetical protein
MAPPILGFPDILTTVVNVFNGRDCNRSTTTTEDFFVIADDGAGR